jgi:hypothetical protein
MKNLFTIYLFNFVCNLSSLSTHLLQNTTLWIFFFYHFQMNIVGAELPWDPPKWDAVKDSVVSHTVFALNTTSGFVFIIPYTRQ